MKRMDPVVENDDEHKNAFRDVSSISVLLEESGIVTDANKNNPLLTRKAMELSLSAPRFPPWGTAQRDLYGASSVENTTGSTARTSYTSTKNKSNDTANRRQWREPRSHFRVRDDTEKSLTRNDDAHNVPQHHQPHHNVQQRMLLQNHAQHQWHRNTQRIPTTSNDTNHSTCCSITTTTASRRPKQKQQEQRHVRRRHPHLNNSNKMPTELVLTRTLVGRVWSVPSQNRFRDNGSFRTCIDRLTVASLPLLVAASPKDTISNFVALSCLCQTMAYGPHSRHQLHLYLPPPHSQPAAPTADPSQSPQFPSLCRPGRRRRRCLVFVHGGAWGSGWPWMYRLVAAPFLLHQQKLPNPNNNNNNSNQNDTVEWAVAILGYRTHPDSPTVHDQVFDLELALHALQQHPFFTNDPSTDSCPVEYILAGHSSGAHIALLLLIARFTVQQKNSNSRSSSRNTNRCTFTNEKDAATAADNNLALLLPPLADRIQFDSFLGVSGPYDISHHFDFEAARGVEEVSPMKAVNGLKRLAMEQNSPARALQMALAATATTANEDTDISTVFPTIALFHGIEDETVPFTATAEAARVLRSCGLTRVDEVYVPDTGHQDAVMQIMMGGRMREAIMDWLSKGSTRSSKISPPCTLPPSIRSRL